MAVATYVEEWRSGQHALNAPSIIVPFDFDIDMVDNELTKYPDAIHVVFDVENFHVSHFEMVAMIANILVDDYDKIVTIRIPASHALILSGYEFNDKVMVQLTIECLHDPARDDRIQILIKNLAGEEEFVVPMNTMTRKIYSNLPPVIPVEEEDTESEDDEFGEDDE